tara:strand:+ start:7112 stop:9046 length:1935 start_codon:yes stop_codon:yes gene_type:complete
MYSRLSLTFFLLLGTQAWAASFDETVRPFLREFCFECHNAKKSKGGIDFTTMKTAQDALGAFETWETALELLKEGEMPPDAAKQPTAADLERIRSWYQFAFVESVKPHPGFFKPRRLSAAEYRNTLRSLFGFDLEVAIIEAEQTAVEKSLVMKLLPTDPPGKSGFKNDTHGNPLTTTIWDQYSYLADLAIERLFEPAKREQLERYTGPIDGDALSPGNAERLVRRFFGKAYRRIVLVSEVESALARIKSATSITNALKQEMKSLLMSPSFIYRGLRESGRTDVEREVDTFELAERLSYFLWGDMPDDQLMDVAITAEIRLNDARRQQVDRLLDSPKSRFFVKDFATQWLTLDAMKQFAKRQLPVAIALQSQPVEFLNHLVQENRPLLELLDSRTTFANPLISRFYPKDRKKITAYRKQKGIELEIVPHTKIELENTAERGGLLTMPGILAMNRGPIQRGTWMLERILGVHLPDPPPDVGTVKPNRPGEKLSFRERFEQHRADPTCAVCHSKIDPLGFALQRYDDTGAYRSATDVSKKQKRKKGDADYESGTIDTTGRLPRGETFKDFAELKQLLLTTQRAAIIENIVERMLSYALCRKLEIYDRPTVRSIARKLNEENGTWRDLIYEIVDSLPFRKTVVKGKKP